MEGKNQALNGYKFLFLMEAIKMADGIVKWFDDKKGYGFIQQKNGQDVFVHHTGIKGEGFKSLKENAKVTFDIEVTKKGQTAVNVMVVK